MQGSKPGQSAARVYLCSFCGQSQTEVKTLVSGPGVFICDECVELCKEIVEKNAATAQTSPPEPHPAPNPLLPDHAPTDALLKTLSGYNGAFARIDAGMQDIVERDTALRVELVGNRAELVVSS